MVSDCVLHGKSCQAEQAVVRLAHHSLGYFKDMQMWLWGTWFSGWQDNTGSDSVLKVFSNLKNSMILWFSIGGLCCEVFSQPAFACCKFQYIMKFLLHLGGKETFRVKKSFLFSSHGSVGHNGMRSQSPEGIGCCSCQATFHDIWKVLAIRWSPRWLEKTPHLYPLLKKGRKEDPRSSDLSVSMPGKIEYRTS